MISALKHMPWLQKLKANYEQLSQRDQKALQLLALAFALTFVYLGIWRPIAEFRADAQADMNSSRDLVEWVRGQEQAIRAIAQSGGQSGNQGSLSRADLLKTITDSADRSGLPLQRFERRGEQGMQIWLENVAFTDLTQWLAHVKGQYGISVDQASVDRTDQPGLVDARITLEI